jgi:hypothetical protein
MVEDAGIGLVEGWSGWFGVGERVGWRLNGASKGDWGSGVVSWAVAGREILAGVVRGVGHGLDLVERNTGRRLRRRGIVGWVGSGHEIFCWVEKVYPICTNSRTE